MPENNVMPRKKPFETIKLLSQAAEPQKYASSGMLFLRRRNRI